MTAGRQQALEELEQRTATLARDIVGCILRREPPAPEQLQAWIHALSVDGRFTVVAHNLDVDQRPLAVEATLTIPRALVETACCLPHAVNPIVGRAFEGLFVSMEKALWRLPPGNYPHKRARKH